MAFVEKNFRGIFRSLYVDGTLGPAAAENTLEMKTRSASALTVGQNGVTNPVLKVDASTTSQATGVKITGAAAAAGVALAVISSGSAENLTIDAKGTGTVTINGTATGAIVLGATTQSKTSAHLVLNTASDSNQVRINSRNFTQASGDSIGYQSKPAQAATTTGAVYGSQISPRIADTFNCAEIVGVHAEPILKGTSGTVSGPVYAIQSQITDENAAGRTIGGDVCGIRFWQQLAAHTFNGNVVPIRWDTHGGAKAWDGFIKLGAALGTLSGTTATDKTANGKIGTLKVILSDGSTIGHIQIYANA